MADDGYLVGYEDGSGNFVEVGRFNNTSENVSDPLIIQHSDSGQSIELGPNGFSTESVSTRILSTDFVEDAADHNTIQDAIDEADVNSKSIVVVPSSLSGSAVNLDIPRGLFLMAGTSATGGSASVELVNDDGSMPTVTLQRQSRISGFFVQGDNSGVAIRDGDTGEAKIIDNVINGDVILDQNNGRVALNRLVGNDIVLNGDKTTVFGNVSVGSVVDNGAGNLDGLNTS